MQYFNNTSQNQRPGDVSPVHFPAAMNGEWRAPDLAASPITLQLLMRQTGLGIKVRFLLALMCIAIIPAISLVFLLGDPAGSERQATVSQALFMQAKAQGTALNQALEARRNTLAGLAKQPELAQLLSGAAGGTELLQAAQQADQASMAWILTKADGAIVAGSPGSKLSGRVLGKTQVVAHPDLLNQLMHAAIKAQAIPQPVIGFDEKAHRGWIAFAAPVGNGALLAVWNMSSVTHDLVTTVPALEGSVAILLDASQRLIASAGTISGKQQPFAAVPGSLATIRLNVNTATAL
ncbi:MAG: hypothetical protein J2P36_32840, partial [Ktedonobacteraceae bacterium]|nr:hypothetical protein [Ktedonobacteraceae bacterium]